jgi:hypothetical protein
VVYSIGLDSLGKQVDSRDTRSITTIPLPVANSGR